jgi:oxygen-independent coproporphyrinogen-3 oxidase
LYSFAQNEKTIEDYYTNSADNQLTIFRGHVLTLEDLIIRRHILNLMYQFTTSWKDET